MSREDSRDDQYAPDQLHARLTSVEGRIEEACERVGRTRDEVTLVAVSKTHPVAAIRTFYDRGVGHFGASYVQEWEEKRDQLPDDIRWHFVGHLQSNKAKHVVDRVHMVHSVDRRSVMKQLHRRASEPVDVLLQINIADQDSKSGVAPEGLEHLLETALEYPNLRLRGLMTLPPYVDDPEENRSRFQRMFELRERGRRWLQEHSERDPDSFEHLSMGMTNDFEVAIEEGATIIRVGTGLFGPRNY